METKANLDLKYKPSEDIVAREIEGELIIVPLVSGIGDMEDELFTLNETGQAIWKKLDGKKSLSTIMDELLLEYDVTAEQLKADVLGLAQELLKRRIIVEAGEG